LILDGTVCPINHPNSFIQQLFYSGKHKIHVIKYEIGVHPITGELVWIGGSIYGSMHNMKLMYLGHILQGLFPNEFILADMGYIGN
jgi:DDE superfamily endonuclease